MLTSIAHWVVANPWVYDLVQTRLGFGRSRKELAPILAATDHQVVLDVGAGTGNWRPLLAPTATYLWLDNDVQKLQGFQAKQVADAVVLCDATRMGVASKSVDAILCIAVAHHIDDDALPRLFSELARVARGRLIFLDPVWAPSRWRARLLWKYDRGSHPRSRVELRNALAPWFDVEHEHTYTIHHEYYLCVARPRGGPAAAS